MPEQKCDKCGEVVESQEDKLWHRILHRYE